MSKNNSRKESILNLYCKFNIEKRNEVLKVNLKKKLFKEAYRHYSYR